MNLPAGLTKVTDSLELLELISEGGEAIVYVDRGWVARHCNDVYAANLNLRPEEIIGRTPFEYLPSFRRSIFFEACEYCMLNAKPVSKIGYSTVLKRWLLVRVFPARGGVLMLANDASESVVKDYNLAQKAVKDHLTGLGNKLAMELMANKALAKAEDFSIIIIGLDRFRDVNDTHGHATGDMALLEIASMLQNSTTNGETLFRLSGDEFAVVRRGEPDGASERAVALLEVVRRPMSLGGIKLVVNACAGTVQSPADGSDYETLLKRAGLALTEAKKNGRDSIAGYRSELEVASRMKAVLEGELRHALEGNQFTLMIQPKVHLSTGNAVGGEALIRWQHPKRGMLAPGVFLGIAADMGMMGAIDQLVLSQTLKFSSQLRDLGLTMSLSINLSVDSLADIYLAERVAQALDSAGVEPSMLEVEIPEGSLMHDVEGSSQIVSRLHEMGVRISIDDFGTGYSSFAYLVSFPVHALKIDRSFVSELATSENSRKIVKGIVRLAHSLSLDVVAEGAEDEYQVALLRKMRCDQVQGYFYAQPMSMADFKAYALKNTGAKTPDAMSI